MLLELCLFAPMYLLPLRIGMFCFNGIVQHRNIRLVIFSWRYINSKIVHGYNTRQSSDTTYKSSKCVIVPGRFYGNWLLNKNFLLYFIFQANILNFNPEFTPVKLISSTKLGISVSFGNCSSCWLKFACIS